MQEFLRSWGLLIAAVLVGVLAFFAATRYLTDAEESLKRSLAGSDGEMVDVVVAAFDLPAGSSIGADNLAVAQVPATNLSGAVITPDLFEQVDGSLLKVEMISGEPLLGHFLEGALIERFSQLLEVGQRAVTIEVDTLMSNAGLLSVGDHVDIFLSGTFETESDSDEESTASLIPLYQRIKVLAVDRNPLLTRQQKFRTQDFLSDEEVFEYSSVTLALEADDADNMAFATSLGNIVFLLRPESDDGLENWQIVNQESVLESNSDGATTGKYAFFGKTSNQAGSISPKVQRVLALGRQTTSSKSRRAKIKSLPIERTQAPTVEPSFSQPIENEDPEVANEDVIENPSSEEQVDQ